MANQGPRGLELLALRISLWSRAFVAACKKQALETGRAIRVLSIRLGQAALNLLKWLRDLCIRFINWLWSAYYRFETSFLGTITDIALTIAALRFFLLLVAVAITLVFLQYWYWLTAYIVFLFIATIRFFRPADIDDNQLDAHKKLRVKLVGAFRWPLRVFVTILGAVSVYALSQVQWTSPNTLTDDQQVTHPTLTAESKNIGCTTGATDPFGLQLIIPMKNRLGIQKAGGLFNQGAP